ITIVIGVAVVIVLRSSSTTNAEDPAKPKGDSKESGPPAAARGAEGDWSHWRGPEQTGVSRYTSLPEKFSTKKGEGSNLIWKAPYGGRSTPLVMNKRVYLVNRCGDLGLHEQERVMCFDADSGDVKWEHKFNVFF